MSNVELLHRWDAVMMRNYGTPPLALVRGSGCRVWDADGREYLDLVAGIAVNTLGHVSNLAAHERGIALVERLLGLVGRPGRVFFCQDGATANEAAYKIARRHGWTADPAGGKPPEQVKPVAARVSTRCDSRERFGWGSDRGAILLQTPDQTSGRAFVFLWLAPSGSPPGSLDLHRRMG